MKHIYFICFCRKHLLLNQYCDWLYELTYTVLKIKSISPWKVDTDNNCSCCYFSMLNSCFGHNYIYNVLDLGAENIIWVPRKSTTSVETVLNLMKNSDFFQKCPTFCHKKYDSVVVCRLVWNNFSNLFPKSENPIFVSYGTGKFSYCQKNLPCASEKSTLNVRIFLPEKSTTNQSWPCVTYYNIQWAECFDKSTNRVVLSQTVSWFYLARFPKLSPSP